MPLESLADLKRQSSTSSAHDGRGRGIYGLAMRHRPIALRCKKVYHAAAEAKPIRGVRSTH